MGRDHWPTSPFYWAAPKKIDGESHAGDQSDKKKNIKIYLIRSSEPMFMKKKKFTVIFSPLAQFSLYSPS